MIASRLGEISALITAMLWVLTGTAFELGGKRVGSVAVNYMRIVMAMLVMGIFLWLRRGSPIPLDASPKAWLWLSISGLAGFVLGDYFLFESYILIGTRIALLIMSLSPIITGILGFLVFREIPSLLSILGILLIITGIMLVVLMKGQGQKLKLSVQPKGLIYAILGAVGQSVGLICSKLGMGNYDAFASTQIRLITGTLGWTLLFIIFAWFPKLKKFRQDPKALGYTFFGAFFGPFLGVSFSLIAVQHAQAAVAAAIMSIMPVLILPFNRIVFKEKIQSREAFGAFITVIGVIILYL
ncbi:MAG: DMT family transporter [Anaerolineaceae bacterium]|nr:DMT family transporter [Anaerolineaceae bacterium]